MHPLTMGTPPPISPNHDPRPLPSASAEMDNSCIHATLFLPFITYIPYQSHYAQDAIQTRPPIEAGISSIGHVIATSHSATRSCMHLRFPFVHMHICRKGGVEVLPREENVRTCMRGKEEVLWLGWISDCWS